MIYHGGDNPLKHLHRPPAKRVTDCQEDEYITGGKKHTAPERQTRKQHTQRDGRAKQLREVGTHDRGLAECVERVEHEPSPDARVLGPVVQEEAAVRGQICGVFSDCEVGVRCKERRNLGQ